LRENKGNFYAILYTNQDSLQMHVSYHATGQRHFKIGPKGRKPDKYYVSNCQPPSTLRGVELVLGANILRGQFQGLRPYNASREQAIVLDADAANFRDDIIFSRVFLLEPNSEPSIPKSFHSGPPLLHVITEVEPWAGIAFFQQSEALTLHNGVVQVRGRVA
jgi:hypothetical protein